MRRLRHNRESKIAIACAAVAVAAGLASVVASQDGHLSPSAAVHISSSDQIAPLVRSADPGFHFVSVFQHYDGTYYYAMARDPLLAGNAHRLIDQPAYRYGHPLNGWLAGLLSFGQARLVPLALLLVGLIGLGVAGWATSRLAVHFGRTPWGGLLIATSPGLLFATSVDTTETVGAALVALAFLAWTRERYPLAVVVITLACLDKEQYITLPLGLALWEAVQWQRHHQRPEDLIAKALAICTGPIALGAWYVYIHAKLHTWPWHYQPGNFGAPLAGWRQAFHLAHILAGQDFTQSEIGTTAPVILVATAAVLLLAVVAALPMRTLLDGTLIGMAVITSMQGWLTLLYPNEIFRTPAIAVLLAVAVLLTRNRPATALASDRLSDEDAEAAVDLVADDRDRLG